VYVYVTVSVSAYMCISTLGTCLARPCCRCCSVLYVYVCTWLLSCVSVYRLLDFVCCVIVYQYLGRVVSTTVSSLLT